MKECGVYVRVSTDRQALIKEGSLDTQASRLKAYVSCRSTSDEPWQITSVYREEGESGKDTNRPELQRLLADIASGRLNVVLCTKIDRLTRSLLDFFSIFKLFQERGVEFISIDESFDTSTATGRAMLKIILVFAELERERTSERTREKMAWRAEEGLWNGGQVLGYDIDPKNKGILVPNPQERGIIEFLFRTYRENRSVRATARAANERGYKTKAYMSRREKVHQGQPFAMSSVLQILRNPVYIGMVKHKGRTIPAKHEPIIDVPLWKDVQSLLPQTPGVHQKHGRERTFVFKLQGLVRCGSCGAYMTPYFGQGRNGPHHYYKCTRKGDGSGRCNMPLVRADALEDVVAERMMILNSSPDLIQDAIARTNTTAVEAIAKLQSQQSTLEHGLSIVERSIANLLDFIKKGEGTESMRLEIRSLEDQERTTQVELSDVRSRLASLSKKQSDAVGLADTLRVFEEIWEQATAEDRAKLFKLHISHVIWHQDRIELGLYNRPPYLMPNEDGLSAGEAFRRLPAADAVRKQVLTGTGLVQRNDQTGSPSVTVLDGAAPGRPSPRSGSASSTSPWMAPPARPWPPTANRRSRSPSGPKGPSKTATSAP
ncbi:MAG: recombinase family protein [Planctomycetes bacterium]|nr:recombinase family protein [Planctomycetota bacterium]